MSSRSFLLLMSLAAAVVVVGCGDRTYLTPSHGRAYHEAFARQTAGAAPAGRRPNRSLQGLDPQETAAVSETYRRTLGTSGGEAPAQPMVIMNPQAAPAGPYIPPPSVPQR